MATKTYKYFDVIEKKFNELLGKLKAERTKPDKEKDAKLISALESSVNVVSVELAEASVCKSAGVSDESVVRYAAAIESTKEAPKKTPKKKAKK